MGEKWNTLLWLRGCEEDHRERADTDFPSSPGRSRTTFTSNLQLPPAASTKPAPTLENTSWLCCLTGTWQCYSFLGAAVLSQQKPQQTPPRSLPSSTRVPPQLGVAEQTQALWQQLGIRRAPPQMCPSRDTSIPTPATRISQLPKTPRDLQPTFPRGNFELHMVSRATYDLDVSAVTASNYDYEK